MKKIILILLVASTVLLTGCTNQVERVGELNNPGAMAMILMPDGSVYTITIKPKDEQEGR